MKVIVFLLPTLIILGASKQNNAIRVYEKASTSRTYTAQEEVSDDEVCEIDNYVQGLLSVVAAEEMSSDDLREMIVNNSEELSLYRNYFRSVEKFLLYGPNCTEDAENPELLPNYESRTIYYRQRVNEKLVEMMVGACSKQFSQDIQTIYSNVSKSLTLKQRNSFKTDRCWRKTTSVNGREKRLPFKKYQGIKNSKVRPTEFFKFKENNYDTGNLTLVQNHIIPLPLIARFYEIWFRSSLNSGFGARTCLVTDRLNYWVKMLQESELISGHSRSNIAYDYMSSNPYLNKVMESLQFWIPGGNVFIAPTPEERGPLYPMFDRREEFREFAIEFDSEWIVGREFYVSILELYRRLHEYVNIYSRQQGHTDLEISIAGSEIIISMLLKFMGREVAFFDIDQWEYRQLTESELRRIREEDRNKYRGKYYWAIKRSSRRTKRSPMQEESGNKRCYSLKKFSKHQWNKLISHSMTEYLQNPEASWYCDFQHLFFDFQFSNSSDDCENRNFDTYLWSKVSESEEWHDCINFNSELPGVQCLAWRRLMFKELGKMEAEQYQQDVKSLFDWLRKKTKIDNIRDSRILPSDKNLVCLGDPAPLVCAAHCRINVYEKEKWFASSQNRVLIFFPNHSYNDTLCRCPEEFNVQSKSIDSIFQMSKYEPVHGSLDDIFEYYESMGYHGYLFLNNKV